jgi:DNA-binding beta-propeller fold protein YncE
MKSIACIFVFIFLAGAASCGMDEAAGEYPNDRAPQDAAAETPYDASGSDSWDDSLPPPEEEIEADFRVPQASGRYIYVANSAEDYVVVVDSMTLDLEVVTVGKKPTAMATEGLLNAAMVINSGSMNISLIKTQPVLRSQVRNFPAIEGLSSLRISPSGLGAVAFRDFDLPIDPLEDPVQGQDVMVVLLREGEETSVHRTCGYMPREVEYNAGGDMAYVVNKDGISIIDFDVVGGDVSPLPIVRYDEALPVGIESYEKDVDISPDGAFAMVRLEESTDSFSTSVWVMSLEGGSHREIVLPAVPYDLDLSPDGRFAVAVLPTLGQIAIIALPVQSENPFSLRDVPVELYAGQSHISDDGSLVALFSNQMGQELVGLYDVMDGSVSVVGLHKTVKTVAFTPGGGILVVIHGKADGPPADPTDYEQVVDHSYGYSLVSLGGDGTVKQQLTPANPEPFLIRPDGEKIYLLQRDDAADVREVEVIDTRSFVVGTIRLGSPPVAIGYVPESDKIFVSQDHTSGRITFIDSDENTQTVTGFELNDWIVE